MWYCIGVVREGQPTHPTNVKLTQTKMTVDFSKDVMLGMLRKGATGNQILDILNVIVSDKDADIEGGYAALSDDDI